MTQVSKPYFSLLDDFASEIGSTLDDLAGDWEENHVTSEERKRSDVSSTSDTADRDEFAKRLAKPLSFHNPVYNMVHKDGTSPKVTRPTLIPLSQLNGGTNQAKQEETPKNKATKSHKHKKKSGIMSKISAVARRHSNNRSGADPPLARMDKKRQSDGSLGMSSDVSSSSNLSTIVDEPVSLPVSNKPVAELKKSTKIPPQKSPRLSKIGNSNSPPKNDTVSDNNITPAEDQKPVQSPKKAANPIVTLEEEGMSTETNSASVPSTPSKVIQTSDLGGSIQSLSSLSEDSPPSDVEVKTMEEVISEVAQEKNEPSSEKSSLDGNGKKIRVFEEKPGRLKRDKTLRWTGTRKAPALMRQFTRRHKTMAPEVYSSTEELAALERKQNKVPAATDSRSCTPSQQTTSFGMGDDSDTYDEANDEMSESEHSDSTAKATKKKTEDNNKLAKPENTKSPSNRDSAFIVLSSLLPPAPRLRRTQSSKVRAYLQKLGSNTNNALGYAVTQFVEETQKNKERRPLVLLHDVRSFLSDIKNYFISNPHIGLAKKIEKIVSKSASVDVDGAVDDALDRLVLYPLHDTIYRCLVLDYKETGQLAVMQEAMNLAKRKTAKELGIRKTLIPPDAEAMILIKNHFIQLQRTYSPYFKLKELLAAVTKIYQCTKDLTVEDQSARNLGADDFLPLLVHAIVHCDFIAADIETQYMDGLLEPALLLGEGGYYLTTLISAIQVVISIQRKEAALPNISDLQGFLKVGISPSESHPFKKADTKDSDEEVVLHKTLHVPPAMTAQNLCDMISKKFNVAVPQNYCLHVVVKDTAYALRPNDCPQLVKMDLLTQFASDSFYFSFQKRGDSPTRQISTDDTEPVLVEVDPADFAGSRTESALEISTTLSTPETGRSPGPFMETENFETSQTNEDKYNGNNQDLLKATDVDSDKNKLMAPEKATDAKDINDNELCIKTPDQKIKENDAMTFESDAVASNEESNEARLVYAELTETSAEEAGVMDNHDNLQNGNTATESVIPSKNENIVTSDDDQTEEESDSTAEKVDPTEMDHDNIIENIDLIEKESRPTTKKLASPDIDVDDSFEEGDLNYEKESIPSAENMVALKMIDDKTSEDADLIEKSSIPVINIEAACVDDDSEKLTVDKKLDEEDQIASPNEDDVALTKTELSNNATDTHLAIIDEVSENSSNDEEVFSPSPNISRPITPDEDDLRPNSPMSDSLRLESPSPTSVDQDIATCVSSQSQSPNHSISSFKATDDVTNNITVGDEHKKDVKKRETAKNQARSDSPLANSGAQRRSPSSPRIEKIKKSLVTSSQDGSDASSTELTPRTSRRSNAIKRRSRNSSSASSGASSTINSPDLDARLKRRSCMPKESVASLTEFFESKKTPKSSKFRGMTT